MDTGAPSKLLIHPQSFLWDLLLAVLAVLLPRMSAAFLRLRVADDWQPNDWL
jgi:hypothetical protein